MGAGSLAFGLLLAFGPSGLRAGDLPPVSKIATVNLDKVFAEYERTKKSDAQLEQLSGSKQQEREKMVSEIKNLREELVLLNEESRAQRQQTIEEKLRTLASFDRSAKEGLRRQRDDAVKGILEEIESAVSGYAKEHGLELVLSDRAVLYGIDAIDITDEILKILNDHYGKRPS